MSYRKVQELRGSYYLYLPKEWCKKINLKPKSELKIQQLEDGSLVIRSTEKDKKKTSKLSIDIGKISLALIKSMIRAAYVVGAEEVELSSKENIPIEKREVVAGTIRELLGFEITEEADNRIVIGDIGFSFEIIPIMRRLFTSVHYMLDASREAIKNSDEELAKSIINRDNDVDRYYYVIERLNHLALEDPSYIWTNKLTLMDILNFNIAAKFIERIGDHTVGLLYEIIEKREIDEIVKELLNRVLNFYEMTYQIFFIKELKDLQAILDERNVLESQIKNLFGKVRSRMQIFHIRRILRYCVDLGQIAIYQSLGKQIKPLPLREQ
jgi:phosphate uptake regulator